MYQPDETIRLGPVIIAYSFRKGRNATILPCVLYAICQQI